MKETDRLEIICNRLYYCPRCSLGLRDKMGMGGINYSSNNVFERYLRIKLQGDTCDIPTTIIGSITSRFAHLRSNLWGREILIPLYSERIMGGSNPKSAYLALKYLLGNFCYNSSRYVKVKMHSGEIYYGCVGMIFDADMKPLFLNTWSISPGTRIDTGGLEFHVTRVKSYVHPSVFHSSGPVEKYIARKVIPYVATVKRTTNFSIINDIPIFAATNYCSIPDIIISDSIEDFIVTPIAPNRDKEDPNTVLSRHLTEIVDAVRVRV